VKPWLSDPDLDLYVGDCRDVLAELPDGAAACCVTSPPYLDVRPEYPTITPAGFHDVFRELRRVVTGPCLLNVGRVFRHGKEVQWWRDVLDRGLEHGFALLDTLVWIKPNANPIRGAVFTDAHEYVFVLDRPGTRLNVDEIRRPYAEGSEARLARRWDAHAGVKGGGRKGGGKTREANELGARPRSYVEVYVGGEKGNDHPAPMPVELAEHLVLLGSGEGQTVIDPFAGSGTTGEACRRLHRSALLIEIDQAYAGTIAVRLGQQSLLGG